MRQISKMINGSTHSTLSYFDSADLNGIWCNSKTKLKLFLWSDPPFLPSCFYLITPNLTSMYLIHGQSNQMCVIFYMFTHRSDQDCWFCRLPISSPCYVLYCMFYLVHNLKRGKNSLIRVSLCWCGIFLHL